MGKLGKCPLCPSNAREVLLIDGKCYGHFTGQEVTRDAKIEKVKEIVKTPIRPVSKKRAKQNSEYSKERDKFLEDNPICGAKLKGCTINSTELHHQEGRENDLLLKKESWIALCNNCHQKATDHSAEAIEKGISKSKHKKK